MSDDPLYLAPRLEPRTAALLDSAPLLHTLVDALGSPLNVLLPDQMADNVRRFRSVLDRHRRAGRIFFAHKANRSSSLVRRLTTTDAALDAASLGELRHALGSGFTGSRIMATGPKDPEFLWLAARSGACLNADGPAELEEAARLVRAHGLPRVRLLLRLSGFETSGARRLSRRSRFGTPVKSLHHLLDVLERRRDELEPIGVGYHLDTTSLDEKAAALEGCLQAMEELRLRGFQPRAIDVGGGFGVNYLAHAAQWERYTTELTGAVMGSRPPLTWGGHGYGLRIENGTLKGALSLYPAHRHTAGAAYLDDLLSRPAPSLGRPLGTLLLESLYDLYVEPGRALADSCGLTLGRVLEVRPTRRRGRPEVDRRTAPPRGRPARPLHLRGTPHRRFGEHRRRALRRTPAGRAALRQTAARAARVPGRREVGPVRGLAHPYGSSRCAQPGRGHHRLAGHRCALGA